MALVSVCLPVSGLVLAVPAGIAGAQTTFQAACPSLADLTVEFPYSSSGPDTWSTPIPASEGGGTATGYWGGTVTFDANGDLSGTLDSTQQTPVPYVEGGTVTGGAVSSDCQTLDFTAQGSGTFDSLPSTTSLSSVSPQASLTVVGNQLHFSNSDDWESITSFGSQSTTFSGGSASGVATPVPSVVVTPAEALPALPGSETYDVTVTGTGPEVPPPAPTGSVVLTDNAASSCVASLSSSGQPPGTAVGSCALSGESTGGAPYTIEAAYTSGDTNYVSTAVNDGPIISGESNGTSATASSSDVTATASGGTSGTDAVNVTPYTGDPVATLNDGTDYFDVSVTPGNSFTGVTVNDCYNGLAAGSLQWWDPTTSDWEPVEADNGFGAPDTTPPSYGQTLSGNCVSIVLDGYSSPNLPQLSGTVFGAVASRAFASADSADATAGSFFTQTVTTTGTPTPTIRHSGRLPGGVHLVDNGNGTATLSGIPSADSGGVYRPTLTATYRIGSTRLVLTQSFTLFVLQTPSITRHGMSNRANVGSSYDVSVSTKGYPDPDISESGSLPDGITFTDNNDGTASLAGIPLYGSEGSYPVILTATNGVGSSASLSFILVVRGPPGFLEICKQLGAGEPTTSQFAFTVGVRTVYVEPGSCSSPLRVASGPEAVTEQSSPSYRMVGCSASPTANLLSCNIASSTATVTVDAGSETVLTVTNGGPPVPLAADAVRLGTDDGGYCAVLSTGVVECWGNNVTGDLGDGTTTGQGPVVVSGITTAVGIAGGDGYCAVLSSGTVDCWGQNLYGDLGDGTTSSSDVPVAVSGITNALSVTGAGDGFSYCAVLTTGGVDCWGLNVFGELGNGTTSNSDVPVAVSGITDAVSLWNNGSSYCAVLTTGGVDCWGSNNGLLGNGTTTSDSDVPVAVEGVGGVGSLGGVFSLAADGDGYCAVVSSGAVDCWGDNPYGDLGDGTSTSSDVPVTVSGVGGSGSLGAVVSLVGGSSSYCAALSSGAVSCWGDNLHGELGNGTSTSSDVPVVASGVTMATSIAVDSAESFCAGLSSGGIDCWGFNQNNQLGNSSVIYGPGNLSSSSDVPVAVSGVMTASSLIGGGGSYCALLTAGSVTCWGSAGL